MICPKNVRFFLSPYVWYVSSPFEFEIPGLFPYCHVRETVAISNFVEDQGVWTQALKMSFLRKQKVWGVYQWHRVCLKVKVPQPFQN